MRKGTFCTMARFAKLLRMRLRSVNEYVMDTPKMLRDREKTLPKQGLLSVRKPREAHVTPPGFRSSLLDLRLGAGVDELLQHRVGLGLGDALLHRLGRAVDQVLGLLQAQARHLAH